MREPRVVIVGGGPAGVAAALRLRLGGAAHTTLIEATDSVGGLARSFDFGGQSVDLGSHRLHTTAPGEVLADIQAMLGDDLLERPRNGRIRVAGRWLRFPLDPAELILRLDGDFSRGVLLDMAARALRRRANGNTRNFGTELENRLGPTIAERFYRPYARKIWGLELEEMSAEQARRRVSVGSPLAIARKAMGRVPGVRPAGSGRYFYPVGGIGRISEAFATEARAAGARLLLGWSLVAAHLPGETSGVWTLVIGRRGLQRRLDCDLVWSTIPITALVALMRPRAPREVLAAAASLEYRGMVLVYMQLGMDQFTEFDAQYFPDPEVSFTRVSEPKNFTGLDRPAGTTVICAELPCAVGDATWNQPDSTVVRSTIGELDRVGLPLNRPPLRTRVLRLEHAYPLYPVGYEGPYRELDAWVRDLPGVLSFGRQGLFAHDNLHHAIRTGYAAAACLKDGTVDSAAWAANRDLFDDHVVQD